MLSTRARVRMPCIPSISIKFPNGVLQLVKCYDKILYRLIPALYNLISVVGCLLEGVDLFLALGKLSANGGCFILGLF